MRNIGGGEPTIKKFSKAVGYGTAIFVGDAVNQVAAGGIEVSATPGTTLYSGVSLNYGPASTATEHLVIISPDAVFEAQDDDATTGLVAADAGLNANLILGAGSATTQISGHEIDQSTADVTNSLDVKLLGLLNVPDNAYGAHARFEITFNKHRMAPGVAGV
jgi:hypothetical protein